MGLCTRALNRLPHVHLHTTPGPQSPWLLSKGQARNSASFLSPTAGAPGHQGTRASCRRNWNHIPQLLNPHAGFQVPAPRRKRLRDRPPPQPSRPLPSANGPIGLL